MVYLITGDNAYRVEQELRKIAGNLPLRKIAGDDLTLDALADVLMGVSLFSSPEVIVLTHVADNSHLWEKLGEWIERADAEKTIVIVEPHPDKRTKAYKAIQKHTMHIRAELWTDREQGVAREWLDTTAKQQGITLKPTHVAAMLQRAMVPGDRPGSMLIDQTRLVTALRSLALVDTVDDDTIAAVMPPAMSESIFQLMELALQKKAASTKELLDELRTREDAHYVFALVSSQWFQFVAVALTSPTEAAENAGVNPYIARKFAQLAKDIQPHELRHLTQLAANIDAGMKLSQFEPWDGVDRFVLGIALR